MALPILQVTKYNTVIPSTGKRVQYRSFLIKEEKILLMAQESGESEQVIQALKDVVNACTFEKIDVDALTSYDLEHLFIQLRMKSVGETIDLQAKCPECKSVNPMVVDLNEVTIKGDANTNPKIQLTDDVGIIARPIPVADMDEVSDKTEDFTKMIALCIESVYDTENVYKRKDTSKAELLEFVSSLNHDQLMKIEAYISAQPKLTYTNELKCHKCGAVIKVELNGLQDFFQ